MGAQLLAERGMGHEDEMVERATGERHAAGEGGRPVAGQAERALLHPDRRGKAGVDLDELDLGEGPRDGARRRLVPAPPCRAMPPGAGARSA